MINDTLKYPLLNDDLLLDLEDRLEDHTITVEDSKLLAHYIESAGYPRFLQDLLAEEGIDHFHQAVRILRHGGFNFEKENDYPSVFNCYWRCLKILQRHLDRGEEIC